MHKHVYSYSMCQKNNGGVIWQVYKTIDLIWDMLAQFW